MNNSSGHKAARRLAPNCDGSLPNVHFVCGEAKIGVEHERGGEVVVVAELLGRHTTGLGEVGLHFGVVADGAAESLVVLPPRPRALRGQTVYHHSATRTLTASNTSSVQSLNLFCADDDNDDDDGN